ncbi:uncharacterized protein LOC128385742 isoform X2 [Panonychus citri]|uniref:uncharacterized protein LOC128385742 isoform X2 n=1 Tax=Panonychus citri TaxID=50023 RepID=UPI002307B3ED|nr:uncharacterized protein LOC128385742 isoform X2 [Panonychus citri]
MNSAKVEKLEDLKAVLKSIIIPYKDGAGIHQIQRDYHELEGRSLPYNEFGYSSPREFLASMSDILMSGSNRLGETVYMAKFGKETLHIQSMVMGQKTVTKKRRKRPIHSGYSAYSNLTAGRYNNFRPTATWGSGWGVSKPINRSHYGGPSVSRNRSIVPAGFGDPRPSSSFVYNNSSNYKPPTQPVTNKLPTQYNPSTKSKLPLQTINVNNQQKVGLTSDRPLPGPSNKSRASPAFLSANDIKNIKDLLRNHGTNGISHGLFQMLYQKKHGIPLDVKSRGFVDLCQAFQSISHICKNELHPSNKYYLVKLVDEPVVVPKVEQHINGTSKSPKGSPKRSPRNSPKKTPVGASQSNGRLADARSGQDNDQDAIIYDAKAVPPEVHARVTEYHVKNSEPLPTDTQVRWSFKLKIMALLMKATEGISVDNFSTDYYLNFKESLDPCLYNFKDYQDMFENLSKELPIEMSKNYAGDDLTVSLTPDWQTQWIEICVSNNQYDALKQMVPIDDVVLPGDIINDVNVDEATVDTEVWHPIILTSVVNPNCIFVNLLGKYYSEALDCIMNKLGVYESSYCVGYEVPSYCLRENFFCVAPFDVDNCWHRVKIVKVEPDRKKVKVAFIDYGGEQLIEAKKLRLMKKEFGHLPAQAIRLSLRGIRPKTDRWPSNAKNEVLAFMNRAMNQNENILCRLHTRQSPNLKETVRFEAEICAKIPIGYIFLHKQLIESGLAVIDDISTIRNKNEVTIPNNDVHRPVRRQTRIAAKKMIATLKNLQTQNGKVQSNELSCDTQSEHSSQMNGDTPHTNGSVDHSNNSEASNLEDKLNKLNL